MDNSAQVRIPTDAYEDKLIRTDKEAYYVCERPCSTCYMWEFADTCWSFTCTHKTQLVGTLGSKAEGLALIMFLFASFTKGTASRVLQQLVHRQLSQKTPADQQHIQANIANPDVCITAVSHTGDAIRRIWWLNVQMHSPVTVQHLHSCTCFSFFAFFLAQPASQHA